MNTKMRLMIAGRSKTAIDSLNSRVSSLDRLDVQLRHIVNGHADPLYGLAEIPDLLVLHIDGLEGGELEALLERSASSRPPMVVVSGSDDPAVMRLAMKAGARDFIADSEAGEVLSSVEAIRDECYSTSGKDGRLIAVINAKGGSGATFISCNLAHIAVCATEESSALIGLETQFPTLPSYFDLKLKHGLVQALDSVEELDSVALDAILTSHKSGLRLLAARPDEFRFSFDKYAERMNQLFDLLQENYANVVVDVPRQLDEVNAQIMSRASRIVLVLQQSMPHVHDATRLQQLLRDQLGIPAEQMLIAVNRYNKGSEIQLADIESAFPGSDAVCVPNQYREVSESVNLGVPIYEHARQSSVTRALIGLQSRLFGLAPGDHSALASGRLSSLFQKMPRQLFGGQ